MRRLGGSFLVLALAAALLAAPARAQQVLTLARGFALENLHDGLDFPTALAFAPDGRIFFVERFVGKVRVIENGVLLPTPFATLTDVSTNGEQGLLGIALDPAFAANGFVYLYYTQAAGPPVTVQPNWRSLQDNVFSTSCASCHAGPTPPASLDLTESASFAQLFEVPSVQAPALRRVDAGDPDASYLVRKLEGGPGIVGARMPPTGAALPPATIAAVRQWIADGAAYNPGDPSNPPQAFRNRVVRYRAVGNVGVDPTAILDGIPAGTTHNGGVLEFAPDGTLLIQTGDTSAFGGALAQNLGSLAGKILRIAPDGSVPANNPFVGTPGARPEVYSRGHRNGFGIVPDRIAATNPPRVYISENGLNSNDEVNLGVAGANYGWPTFSGIVNQPGFTDPLYAWNPVVAPTGIERYTGGVYPAEYAGNLFVGQFNLRDVDPNPLATSFATVLNRFRLAPDGNSVLAREDFLIAYFPSGRFHPIDVIQGPDGLLYFTLVNASTDLKGTIWRVNWVDDDYDGCVNASDPAPNTPSADADGDTWGADCDCNDANANVNPGRTEVTGNGIDDDCNPATPDNPPPGCRADAAGGAPLGAAAYAAVLLGVALAGARRRI